MSFAIALLLATVQAITFSLTLSQYRSIATLRYPQDKSVTWLEVCVETEGEDIRGFAWYTYSCWTPRFSVEDYSLKPDTTTIRAHLRLDEDGQRETLHTPVLRVRPTHEE